MNEKLGDKFRRVVHNLGRKEKLPPGWTPDSVQEAAGIVSRKETERLEALATIDDLTGLENIRSFKGRLGKAFVSLFREEKKRENEPKVISIAMGDIDDFKAINDRYGHPTGDRVLQAVAKAISEGMRGNGNSAARYGGEEFIFGFIGLDESTAFKIIERIREAIKKLHILSDDGQEIPITMSFGITASKENSRTLDGAIEQADVAMYQAKNIGKEIDGKIVKKNCTVLFTAIA